MHIQYMKEPLRKLKPYFPQQLQELGVNFWRNIEIFLASLLEHRSIINTHRIVWPAAEVADFDKFKILAQSKDEILVDVAFTLMSPGTEKAQFLGLPGTINHDAIISYLPGYSGSGKVIKLGKNVTRFNKNDRVAGRIPHGTPEVVHENFLFHVPKKVSLEEASFIELGIIVLQGIRKARIRPGESILILGQGLIGQLANRLSRLSGACPVVGVGKTRAKEKESLGKGGADKFLTIDELNNKTGNHNFDIVIEATGVANILPYASNLLRPGGRLIGLGTPRGRGVINVGQNKSSPGITIIGAHITGMPDKENCNDLWTYRSEGLFFLSLLAEDKLVLEDLITEKVDPSKANQVYDSLRTDNARMVGILFDWNNY